MTGDVRRCLGAYKSMDDSAAETLAQIRQMAENWRKTSPSIPTIEYVTPCERIEPEADENNNFGRATVAQRYTALTHPLPLIGGEVMKRTADGELLVAAQLRARSLVRAGHRQDRKHARTAAAPRTTVDRYAADAADGAAGHRQVVVCKGIGGPERCG